jgi:hypothetical protein
MVITHPRNVEVMRYLALNELGLLSVKFLDLCLSLCHFGVLLGHHVGNPAVTTAKTAGQNTCGGPAKDAAGPERCEKRALFHERSAN